MNHLKLVVAFLLGVVVGQHFHPDIAFRRQQTQATMPPQEFTVTAVTGMPDVTVDLKMVIDTLAIYNVEHETSTFFGSTFYGATDFNHKTIHISDMYDLADRRETVLHELIHVAYKNLYISSGDPISEITVDSKAQELYKQLYVNPPQN